MSYSEMAPVFQAVKDKLIVTFMNTKMVIFVIGGFGLIALSFLAIFGKVRWGWFAGLAFGLAMVAAAGWIIDYTSQDDQATKGSEYQINKDSDSYKPTSSVDIPTPNGGADLP